MRPQAWVCCCWWLGFRSSQSVTVLPGAGGGTALWREASGLGVLHLLPQYATCPACRGPGSAAQIPATTKHRLAQYSPINAIN
ncbi:hypothetical protein J6590_037330 [Homalodisca vitripennis]|nr:hypothetical protein J6590_037330 [Homalodisca vitripennis]